MPLPRFLGNRTSLASSTKTIAAVQDIPEIRDFAENYAYGDWNRLELYGSSFRNQINIPANTGVHQAFVLDIGDRLLSPQCAIFTTDQAVRIQLSTGAVVQSIHELSPGTTRIEFTDLYILPHYGTFWFDIYNNNEAEAHIECQLVCHIIARSGDLISSSAFSTAHVETREERAARETREAEARQRRIEAEAKAWNELEIETGTEAANFLKEESNHWYTFIGSNQNTYAVSGNGNLANITKGREYCLQLIGVPHDLPIPDVILEKIKWCKHNADEVEEKANDIREFDRSSRTW